MRNLINLINDKIEFNPDILGIPEFKAIWVSDKTRNKVEAMKSIMYVFYIADNNSPYANMAISSRYDTVKRDLYDHAKWKEPKHITAALEKYSTLQETPSTRLYIEVERTKDSMANYLKTINDSDTGINEDNIDAVLKLIDKVGNVITNSNKVKESIIKESASDSKLRGGAEKGIFEDEM